MARVLLPFLALLVSATYVAARIGPAPAPAPGVSSSEGGSLEALCKNTLDEQYCLNLLKPLVVPSTSFNSLKWNRAVLSKALTKARTAGDFMTRHVNELDFKQHSLLKDCLDSLDSSVELLQQAAREYVEVYRFHGMPDFELHKTYVKSLMETASFDQESCYKSLDGAEAAGVLTEVRRQADEAYKANRIAAHVMLNV